MPPVLTGPALVQELLHHHLGDVVDVLRVVRQNQVQLEHIMNMIRMVVTVLPILWNHAI